MLGIVRGIKNIPKELAFLSLRNIEAVSAPTPTNLFISSCHFRHIRCDSCEWHEVNGIAPKYIIQVYVILRPGCEIGESTNITI